MRFKAPAYSVGDQSNALFRWYQATLYVTIRRIGLNDPRKLTSGIMPMNTFTLACAEVWTCNLRGLSNSSTCSNDFVPLDLSFFFFFVSAFKSDIIFAIAYYSRSDLTCYSLLIGFQWCTRLNYVEYRRHCNVHIHFLWFGIVHGRSVLFEIEIYVSLCIEARLRVGLLVFNGED